MALKPSDKTGGGGGGRVGSLTSSSLAIFYSFPSSWRARFEISNHILQKLRLVVFLDLFLFNLCGMIKKITQTAVINIVFQRIFIRLDVSYASQHTFSKVTVTIIIDRYPP